MAVNVEEKMKEASVAGKLLMGLGALCFILMAVFVMIHLGFMAENTYRVDKPIQFLSRANLWYLHIGLGTVGGIMLDYRHPLIAALSGLAAALAMTWFELLYLGWRETILEAELLIPLLVALFVGVPINRFLKRLFKKAPAEKSAQEGH